MANSEVVVKIRNWDKFNPRKDVKNATWFRLSHSLFDDPDFYGFTHSELVFWIYLLTLASKKNGEAVPLNIHHAHRSVNLEREVIHRTLKKLQKLRCIEVRTLRGRYADGTFAAATNETNERNETNVTDETPQPPVADPPLDFDSLWEAYPRKAEKQEGLKRAREVIKTPEELEALCKAAANYAEYCRHLKTEERFIKHLATFVENRASKPYTQPWREFTEPRPLEQPGAPPLHPEIARIRAMLPKSGAA